jgi:glutamate racemase
MPNRPIGIFDSGVGGVSVLKEIHKQLPNEQLIYIADSAYAPYGDKDAKTIQQRCRRITQFLLQHNIKALVIACNTATAIAAEALRAEFPEIIIIGLEPAIKPAVELTRTGKIGILATKQTIKSPRLANLIHNYAQGINIEKQACPGLAEQVEAGRLTSKKTQKLLSLYLQPMLKKGIDTLVLGCTHYPFLLTSITQLTQGAVQILETSVPVTQQLQRVLASHTLLRKKSLRGNIIFYSSAEQSKKHRKSVQLLCQEKIQIEALPALFS